MTEFFLLLIVYCLKSKVIFCIISNREEIMPKNKVKLNDKTDKTKSQKKKTIKEEKYMSEESKEVRNFIIILLSVIVIVLIVYGVSKIFIDDQPASTERTIQPGTIDYDKVSVGTMLNRNYSEYYVAIYDEEAPEAVVYSALITSYLENEDALKVFYCDLGSFLNADYYVGSDGESNPDAQSISEFAFGDLTLIKVENGRITEYLEDLDAIKAEFNK